MQGKEPFILAIHPTLAIVYAVSEIADLNGQPTGGIISFTIDMKNGHLTQQSVQPSNGKGPCHLSIDAQGKVLLAANYGSGSTICLGSMMTEAFSPSSPIKRVAPVGLFNTPVMVRIKHVKKHRTVTPLMRRLIASSQLVVT